MIQEQDVVMLLSQSGESPEIKLLLSFIKGFRNPLIGMVGNLQSTLARQCDVVLNTFVSQEACFNNLAPTSSTTVQMVMGDALAVTLMEMRGFGSEDFARFHPGGTLGKRLYLRVQDVYIHNEKPRVDTRTLLREVIIEIHVQTIGRYGGDGRRRPADRSHHGRGPPPDAGKEGHDRGHDGRRHHDHRPKTIEAEALAVEALDLMRNHDITRLVVTSGTQYLGFIDLNNLIREGII